MGKKQGARRSRRDKHKPEKVRHYFFLNPYDDVAFTKCPKCNDKTKVRKFPLAVHIEPEQLIFLNKTCRYCAHCDLIVVKQREIETLLTAQFEKTNPGIIGNEYLVFGTLDRTEWQTFRNNSVPPRKAIEHVYVFRDVWNFKLVGGWGLAE